MDELNRGVKAEILQMKIERARQAYYSHQVDAQVARDIGGMEGILEAAQKNMTAQQKLIDAYTKLLEDLPDAQKP